MAVNVWIAKAWATARGDVYEEDEIGNVVCPHCARCAQQAKFLNRIWHRVYVDHQITCSECGVVHQSRTKLGWIKGVQRWRCVRRRARELQLAYSAAIGKGGERS
jgi:hypothetical protein